MNRNASASRTPPHIDGDVPSLRTYHTRSAGKTASQVTSDLGRKALPQSTRLQAVWPKELHDILPFPMGSGGVVAIDREFNHIRDGECIWSARSKHNL
jgi:hypothetical protein